MLAVVRQAFTAKPVLTTLDTQSFLRISKSSGFFVVVALVKKNLVANWTVFIFGS
jgi:hypothetical protein